MTRYAVILATLCPFAVRIAAQTPGIAQNGVVNSASQIAPTLAGGAIAPGALVTIRGVRLGSSTRTTVVTLLNTPVEIATIRPEQIEVVLPASLPSGSAPLTVTVNGQASIPFPVEVVPSNPGIFSRNGLGWGAGRIDNQNPDNSFTANSTTRPVQPGQRARLRATGLGSVKRVDIVIGTRLVRSEPAHRASQPGEDEIDFRVPPDVEQGCNVPVYIRVTPLRASNVVTIAIRNGAGPCESGPIPALTTNQKLGIVILSRTRIQSRNNEPDPIYDEALAAFVATNETSKPSPLALLPPPGTCTAYTSSFQSASLTPSSFSSAFIAELGGAGLDAGASLMVRGSLQNPLPQNPNAPGFYTRLGNSDRHTGPRTARILLPFLDPGNYTLEGRGGKDVGPFSLTIPGPAPFEWSNRGQTNVVVRSRSLPIRWRGIPSDRLVVMLATNVDQITTAIGATVCTARADAGQFTIPAALMANLPQSRDMPGIPYDRVLVASLPAKTAPVIRATGLNGGEVFSLFADSRVVEFR